MRLARPLVLREAAAALAQAMPGSHGRAIIIRPAGAGPVAAAG
jgi:hypothetical protein